MRYHPLIMADSILNLSGASRSASIGTMAAGQEVSKAVMQRLLGSIEQAGQASLQSAPNRIDRVQISQEGQRRLAAEQAG